MSKKAIYRFENISNDTEAYLLGLIYADGYITGKNVFGIKLMKSDKYLIEFIRDYIAPTSNLYEDGNAFKFTIHDTDIVNNLIKLGIRHNKTYADLNLPNINKELLLAFIRGYFDGNGTVYIDKSNKNKLCLSICSICCNFLLQIENVINENHIYTTFNKENRNHLGTTDKPYSDMYRIYIRREQFIKTFFKKIYKNSTIHLHRKFDKIDNYVNTVLNKENNKSLSA